jgi:hypothetical protein
LKLSHQGTLRTRGISVELTGAIFLLVQNFLVRICAFRIMRRKTATGLMLPRSEHILRP